VFVHDEHIDTLRPAAAYGPIHQAVEGLQIPLGQRLSGWVGATRAAQRNADPRLDLEDAAIELDRPLVSALCVPIEDAARLVGVVTLYSETETAFSEADLESLRTLIGISVRLNAAIASQGTPDRRSAA
jgi:GAF domain-containing protein